MWNVSWFYEKVHNIANFGGYAAILCEVWILLSSYKRHFQAHLTPVQEGSLYKPATLEKQTVNLINNCT